MKIKLIIILLVYSPLYISSQCYDCYSKKPEIAVGITLLSNMRFTSNQQPTQPFELNLRHKISDNSTLRFGTPIAWKQNIPGEPYPNSYTSSLEQYVENMQNMDLFPHYSAFQRVLDYYYNLFGVSLGYDYNISLSTNVSTYIGFDLSYYNHQIISNYYRLYFGTIDENQQFQYFSLEKRERVDKSDLISAKPLLGLRFTFQKLTLEADLAYHIAYNFLKISVQNRYWLAENNAYNDLNLSSQKQTYLSQTITPNRIVYNLRIFYNF